MMNMISRVDHFEPNLVKIEGIESDEPSSSSD